MNSHKTYPYTVAGACSGSMDYPKPAPPATLSADELAYYVGLNNSAEPEGV